jgi:hypothetical protein
LDSLVALLVVANGVADLGSKVRSLYLISEQIFIYPVGRLSGRVDLEF